MGKPVCKLYGQRFGRLVAIEPYNDRKPGQRTRWRCRCDCGRETVTETHSLRRKNGGTVSCGCLKLEKIRTHGLTKSPTYKAWKGMWGRCTQPSSFGYEHYKKRGITVCERWRKFENFLADMGERPAGFTLDRINNDGNYEPGNCRWATMREQGNNRSTNLHFEYRGKTYTLAELARETGVSKDILRHRLVRTSGWTVEGAVSTPSTPPQLKRSAPRA